MDSQCSEKPVPAVAAVIVEEGRLLLIKRGKEPSKGKWSVPGGSVEWGETLQEALKREVREETGLEIEVGDVAGVFDVITEGSADDASRIIYHYVIIDYFAHRVGGELTPDSDADEARWVPISGMGNYDLTPHLCERLKEMGIHVSN